MYVIEESKKRESVKCTIFSLIKTVRFTFGVNFGINSSAVNHISTEFPRVILQLPSHSYFIRKQRSESVQKSKW